MNKRILLNFKKPKFYYGVDIGGTKIKAVLLSGLHPQKPKCFVMDTPKEKARFLKALHHFVETTLSKSDFLGKSDLEGIGVGVPGLVNREHEVLLKAPNLPFLNGWNIKKFFKTYAPCVAIDNDSRCMLRAEVLWGAAQGYKNVVGIAVGTGIGGGMTIGGKMYYGSTNAAGEFGHMIMHVTRDMQHAASFEELAGKKAFEKYGDRSKIIGIGMANLINAFDPEIVVLGGGGITSSAAHIDKIKRVARQYLISPRARKMPIVQGKLGDYAGAMGAALLLK